MALTNEDEIARIAAGRLLSKMVPLKNYRTLDMNRLTGMTTNDTVAGMSLLLRQGYGRRIGFAHYALRAKEQWPENTTGPEGPAGTA